MSPETSATDRDETATTPRDEASSPEGGSIPAGANIILTDRGKPAVVLGEVAVRKSPKEACLHPEGKPEEADESPFNLDSVMELIRLFREEFISSTRKRKYWFGEVSRADEWPAVEARIHQVLEETNYNYAACAGFVMTCKCDLVHTDKKARFVIPEPNRESTNSLADVPWTNPKITVQPKNIPKSIPDSERVAAPLVVGGKVMKGRGEL